MYTKPVLLPGQLWSSFTLNVAARPINLGLYPWEEIAQVFMVSGTFGVLKTESKFYVTECHNLQQYHPINISIYLSKPSEFTRAELSLVSAPPHYKQIAQYYIALKKGLIHLISCS